MCKKLIFLVSLVAILGMVGSAHGAHTVFWDDGGTDHLWSTGANWNSADTTVWPDNVVPSGSSLNAGIGSHTALFDTSVGATGLWAIHIGPHWATESAFYGPGTLTMTGGTLDCRFVNVGMLGAYQGDYEEPMSYLNMSGGTLTTTNGHINVGGHGKGTMNMTGGTVNIGWKLTVANMGTGEEGIVNLSGGSLNIGTVSNGHIFMKENGRINISNYAEITILGFDRVNAMNLLIESGKITGDGGGTYGVLANYDGTDTVITPEPATMMLLGLGGLFLVRRKR